MVHFTVVWAWALSVEREAHNNDTSKRRGVKLMSKVKQAKEAIAAALPNQPMERTPPRCALRRRSRAR
jgi:hypothetical protein